MFHFGFSYIGLIWLLMYYSLDDEHVAEIFELTVEHIGHMH